MVLGLSLQAKVTGSPSQQRLQPVGGAPQQEAGPHPLSLRPGPLGGALCRRRRRKKAREEQAAQVYHLQLLREGAERSCALQLARRPSRQQLHAQQQVQVGLGCPHCPTPSPVGHGAGTAPPDWRLVAGGPQSPPRSASLCHAWKQKALGPAGSRSPLCPLSPAEE